MCDHETKQQVPASSQFYLDLHSTPMRYGKSAGVHEINEQCRRKANMSLKKAAPGAPFGWTSEGTPYHGTTYALRDSANGLKFASVSTRNAEPQYFLEVHQRSDEQVALGTETHGTVGGLQAGESSSASAGEVLEPRLLAKAHAIFVRLLGAQTVKRFEDAEKTMPHGDEPAGADSDSSDVSEPPDDDEDQPAPSSEITKAKTPSGHASTSKASAESEASKAIGQKRQARMAMVDEIRQQQEANKRPARCLWTDHPIASSINPAAAGGLDDVT